MEPPRDTCDRPTKSVAQSSNAFTAWSWKASHEDYGRSVALRQRLEHREAVHSRHLDVEQEHVRAEQLDELQGLAAPIGIAGDLDVWARRQQLDPIWTAVFVAVESPGHRQGSQSCR